MEKKVLEVVFARGGGGYEKKKERSIRRKKEGMEENVEKMRKMNLADGSCWAAVRIFGGSRPFFPSFAHLTSNRCTKGGIRGGGIALQGG